MDEVIAFIDGKLSILESRDYFMTNIQRVHELKEIKARILELKSKPKEDGQISKPI